MARLARQEHLPQSGQSTYQLPTRAQIPGATDPVAVIEDLAIARLPEHLTEQLRAQRAEREQAQAQKDAALERVQAQRERISELADSELHALVADARVAFGRRATDTFHIERAVRTELTQRAEQPEPGHDATAATQETIATDTGVGEEEAAS